jgi:hypothetical protein
MATKRKFFPKVICPGCKIEMVVKPKPNKAAVIDLRKRTTTVVFQCPSCGTETERQIAI